MGRLILYVLSVAALVAVAVWLANDPGGVHLAWHGWRVDSSVGVLVAAIIVVVALLLFVVRLAGALAAAMRAIAARRREQRLNRGMMSLGDGFAAGFSRSRGFAVLGRVVSGRVVSVFGAVVRTSASRRAMRH